MDCVFRDRISLHLILPKGGLMSVQVYSIVQCYKETAYEISLISYFTLSSSQIFCRIVKSSLRSRNYRSKSGYVDDPSTIYKHFIAGHIH